MGKLINRIPGSRLLISSCQQAMSTSVLKALPGKLDIKRHSPSILYIQVSVKCTFREGSDQSDIGHLHNQSDKSFCCSHKEIKSP